MDEALIGRNGLPNRTWLLVLALVVSFFVVSMSLSYRSIRVMTENNHQVTNNLQIITLVKDLRLSISRAESGQRGYLLTNDAEYLGPYHQTLARIDELLKSLSGASTSLEQQQLRFVELTRLVQAKTSELQQTVAMMDAGDRAEAVRRIRTDVGRILATQIDALIDEMEADEVILLYKNRTMADENRTFILITLIVTNVIGLLLSCAIFIALYRNARKVAVLYGRIEKSNEQLEEKVEERTQALQLFSDELQRSNRELEDFAFVASHDLQEPLRKIRAFGDRLLQKYSEPLGERGADYVARMYGASERMSLLIDDLLSFSRVTTKQKPFVHVKLDTIMQKVCDDLEYAIEKNEAKITCDPLPEIDADETQIGQVFMNLLGNSMKFHSPGVAPVISVTCDTGDHCRVDPEDERQWCCLRFKDNGIGFEPQYSDRIFNLFQRLHGREEYAGTGIGLALCRKIIERHGGTITAESEPDKGTEFIIKLPMTQFDVESIEDIII